MAYIARKGPRVYSAFRKWAYNISGFNRYGLQHDDLYYENEDVKEAIRRLPVNLYDERAYRIIRAFQLNSSGQLLPKEQWTKWEEDEKYLQPYLQEVIRERVEKEEWGANK